MIVGLNAMSSTIPLLNESLISISRGRFSTPHFENEGHIGKFLVMVKEGVCPKHHFQLFRCSRVDLIPGQIFSPGLILKMLFSET